MCILLYLASNSIIPLLIFLFPHCSPNEFSSRACVCSWMCVCVNKRACVHLLVRARQCAAATKEHEWAWRSVLLPGFVSVKPFMSASFRSMLPCSHSSLEQYSWSQWEESEGEGARGQSDCRGDCSEAASWMTLLYSADCWSPAVSQLRRAERIICWCSHPAVSTL